MATTKSHFSRLGARGRRHFWLPLGLVLCIVSLVASAATAAEAVYFPPLDSEGGWRTLTDPDEILRVTGINVKKLDAALDVAKASSKNGGVLVVRHGWLVYEKYFGYATRDTLVNQASCGKSYTSIATGILMAERPELFPDGLDQKVFTPTYFPPEAFPLADPRMANIKLGQLLAFSAGIRGNNPGMVYGKPVTLDPVGPDGWQASVDAVAWGKRKIDIFEPINGKRTAIHTQTVPLWCEPGGGYSYATSSIHLVSIIIRHVTGMELEDYVRSRLAEPMGWAPFTYGGKQYKEVTHTPGGGSIAVRSTDVLRFCYMLLHEGKWQDKQIAPAEYVQKCGRTSPYNPHARIAWNST